MLKFSSIHEENLLEMNTGLYATVGCHPTRSTEFENDPSGYFQALDKLIGANLSGPGRAVAVGECGLDYDRTHFASTVVQQRHFRGCGQASHQVCIDGKLTGSQLALAKKYHLPLFLHSRAAHKDFVQILREEGFGEDGGRAVGGRGGVVHSFTGSPQDAVDYVRVQYLPLEPDITERNTQINMGFHVRFVLS